MRGNRMKNHGNRIVHSPNPFVTERKIRPPFTLCLYGSEATAPIATV